jgi:hypothetical protein
MQSYWLFICALFNDAVNSLDYIASDDRMINESVIGTDMEESGRGQAFVIIPAFAWRDWLKPQSRWPISGTRYEPGTSRIQNRSTNHPATIVKASGMYS